MVSTSALLFGSTPDICTTELQTVFTFALARFVQGGGGGQVSTVAMSMLSDKFPSDHGKVLGLASSSGSLAIFMGPPVGGFLYELGGFGLPFLLARALPPVAMASPQP
jgi:MFS family permease